MNVLHVTMNIKLFIFNNNNNNNNKEMQLSIYFMNIFIMDSISLKC